MTKIARSKVSIKDLKTNQVYEVLADQTPRPKEAGLVVTAKINQIGISELQAKGTVEPTVSSPNWKKFLMETLGISEAGIGTLKAENYETSVNGVVGGITQPQAQPVAVEEPMVATIPADTTEDPMVAQIQAIIKSGVADTKKIQGDLITKVGQVRAVQLWNEAVKVEKKPETNLFEGII